MGAFLCLFMGNTIRGLYYDGKDDYPVEGQFYSEDGKLLYDGRFHIGKQGGVGYPRVILPEGYGKLF